MVTERDIFQTSDALVCISICVAKEFEIAESRLNRAVYINGRADCIVALKRIWVVAELIITRYTGVNRNTIVVALCELTACKRTLFAAVRTSNTLDFIVSRVILGRFILAAAAGVTVININFVIFID